MIFSRFWWLATNSLSTGAGVGEGVGCVGGGGVVKGFTLGGGVGKGLGLVEGAGVVCVVGWAGAGVVVSSVFGFNTGFFGFFW